VIELILSVVISWRISTLKLNIPPKRTVTNIALFLFRKLNLPKKPNGTKKIIFCAISGIDALDPSKSTKGMSEM
jgi:hypothetical protein